LKGGNREVLKT